MRSPTDQGSFAIVVALDEFNEFKIRNEDISECYFIEDIYTMSMMGRMSIHDRYGIREYGPLTGDERMFIQYGSTGTVTKEFSIYNIPAVENIVEFQQQQSSIISVYFYDTYYPNLTQKKFCKSWDKDTLWTSIVGDIFEKMLTIPSSSYNIEQSTNKTDSPFYIPNWNVANTLRYIMERAVGANGCGYLCFPNSEKLINFVTIENLIKTAKTDSEVYVFNTDDTSYENKILGWDSMGVDHNAIKEVGGGTMYGFNPATKSFIGLEEDETYKYSEMIKKMATLGKQSLFDGDLIDNDSTKYNLACALSGEDNPEVIKNIYTNNMVRRYALQNTLKIVVPGHDKRKAGEKINIMWPSMQLDDLFNSMDSGQYLIKSVTHYFCPMTSPMYRQALVLIKNAYTDNKYGDNDTCSSFDLFDMFNLNDMLGFW